MLKNFLNTITTGAGLSTGLSKSLDIIDKLVEIDRLKQQGQVLEVESIQLIECQCCGVENFVGYEFCETCGSDLPRVIGEVGYVCPSCGTLMNTSKRFCGVCGFDLFRVKLCNCCGAPLKKGKKFCMGCGQKVVQQEKIDVEIVCQNCGKVVLKGKNFCTVCGTAVGNNSR